MPRLPVENNRPGGLLQFSRGKPNCSILVPGKEQGYSGVVRKLGKLAKLLLKALLVLAVALLLFLVEEHFRGKIELARYRQELVAKGEILDAKTFLVSTNLGENGAPEVLKAANLLTNGIVLPQNYPVSQAVRPSGRAVVGFQQDDFFGYGSEPKFHIITNTWQEIADDLKAHADELDRIRAALNKPTLKTGFDLSEGPNAKFSHLVPAKRLTFWFGSKSQLALRRGDTHQATGALLSMLELPRFLAEDKILISELVRIAIMSIDRAHIWEALQADGWRDEDLARLQAACQKPEFIGAMGRALEGERIFAETGYQHFRASNNDTFKRLFWNETPWGMEDPPSSIKIFVEKQIYCRIWRFAWSYQDQCDGLRKNQQLIEIAREAEKAKSYAAVSSQIQGFLAATEKQNWYDRLRFATPTGASMANCISKALRAETERSQLLCAIALKRYYLREKKYPPSLDALVPAFLNSIPTDYMGGRQMKYHLKPDGGFSLYSVGENGTDDGGDETPLPDAKSPRLLWSRKDFVWPAPAAPEEVTAWREESAKGN